MICGKDWIDERLLKRIAVTARWVGARPKRVSEHRVRTSEGATITRGEITEILARAFPDDAQLWAETLEVARDEAFGSGGEEAGRG